MSSRWVNKYAIMRDLSLVQGCVPVDVAGTVEAGDKPPSRNVNEDTEEDYYRNWVGGNGDFAEPDLGLIKHMLEVVRNHDVPTEEEVELERTIQISKLNPNCPDFYPESFVPGDGIQNPQMIQDQSTLKQNTNIFKMTSPKSVKPKKKKINVAVASILENIKDNTVKNKNTVNFKPILPDDTINTKAMDKVSDWFATQIQPTKKKNNKNTLQLELDPSAMFKKKVSHNVTSPAPTPTPMNEVKSNSAQSCAKYVPSNRAAEYYKKFLECSRMKEIVQENVWTKVEKKMREIDERRAAEAELFALSLALCRDDQAPGILADDPIQQKLDMVFLPSHRHALPSPCRVCEHSARHARYARTDTPTEKVDDFCKRLIKVNCNYDDEDDDDIEVNYKEKCKKEAISLSENEKVNNINDDNWRVHDKAIEDNLIDDWCNKNNTVDENIQCWISKPEDKEDETHDSKKTQNNNEKLTDSVNTENSDCWASLDDIDEIDAWKYEILEDDENENYNEFYESFESIDSAFQSNKNTKATVGFEITKKYDFKTNNKKYLIDVAAAAADDDDETSREIQDKHLEMLDILTDSDDL